MPKKPSEWVRGIFVLDIKLGLGEEKRSSEEYSAYMNYNQIYDTLTTGKVKGQSSNQSWERGTSVCNQS